MDPTTIVSQVTAAFQMHNWLALVLVLALVVRKWTGPDSKSPIPIVVPPNWRPVVFAFTGLVITVGSTRNAGQPWTTSLLAGAMAAAATGFLDGLLAAIFGKPENAPTWARWIVGVFDELEGGGKAPPAPPADALKVPPTQEIKIMTKNTDQRSFLGAARVAIVSTVVVAVVAAVVAGCAAFNKSVLPADFEKNGECVANQLVSGQTSVVAIEIACLPGQLQSVEDLVSYLVTQLGSKVANPAAVLSSMGAPETKARLASQAK